MVMLAAINVANVGTNEDIHFEMILLKATIVLILFHFIFSYSVLFLPMFTAIHSIFG